MKEVTLLDFERTRGLHKTNMSKMSILECVNSKNKYV